MRRLLLACAGLGLLTVVWAAAQTFLPFHEFPQPELARQSNVQSAGKPSDRQLAPKRDVRALPLVRGAQAVPERVRPAPDDPALRLLLLGSDARRGSALQGRPDAILVVILPKGSDQVGVISLPRDLWIEPVADAGAEPEPEDPLAAGHRLNESLVRAKHLGVEPLEHMERVVEDTLALPIDHTAFVTMAGFAELIDALGGVQVDVPCPIVDSFIDDSAPSGRRLLQVEAGRQSLSGDQAVLYMRSRHGRSDFSRARRQQAVLRGLRQRATSFDVLPKVPQLLGIASRTMHATMARTDMAALALQLSQRDLRDIKGVVIGHPEAQPHITEDGKAVLLASEEDIREKAAGLFAAPAAGTRPAAAPCPAADIAVSKNWH